MANLKKLIFSYYLRLIASFLILLSLMAIAILVSVHEVNQIVEKSSSLSLIQNAQIEAGDMRSALLEDNLRITQFVLLNQPQALTEYTSRTTTGFSQNLNKYLELKQSGSNESQFVSELTGEKIRFDQLATQLSETLTNVSNDSAVQLLKGDFNAQSNLLNTLLNEKQLQLENEAASTQQLLTTEIAGIEQFLIFGGLVIGILGLLAALFLTLLLGRSVQKLRSAVNKVAKGNLKARVVRPGKDELGQIGRVFNQMMARLERSIKDIQEKRQLGLDAGQEVTTIVTQLSSAASQQSSMANGQSISLTELTANMDAFNDTASQISGEAKQVANSAKSTLDYTTEVKALAAQLYATGKRSQQYAENNLGSTYKIQSHMNEFGKVLDDLKSKSHQIDNIIKLIKDIADQTHLLALNAAIECAGVGEQGQRFKVVVSQIKQLADKSQKATAHVNQVINEVRNSIELADLARQEAVETVVEGVDRSEDVYKVMTQLGEITQTMDERFGSIVNLMQNITQRIDQINMAIFEQGTATYQVTLTVKALDTNTREAASTSQQLAATAQQLQQLSVKMTRKLAV